MDQDKKDEGLDDYASSEGVNETSFVTGSEGEGSSPRDDPEKPIRSSRTMPVPEHLKQRTPAETRENLSEDRADSQSKEVTPPSTHDEAVADSEPHHADDEGLTPEEVAVIMNSQDSLSSNGAAGGGHEDVIQTEEVAFQQRQKDRSSYLPSADRRGSNEEAIEMIPAEERVTNNVEESQNQGEHVDGERRLSQFDIEDGRQEDKDGYKCYSCGPLNTPIEMFCRYLRRQSATRLLLFSLLIMVILGVLLFVSLFPASFVYVNYHEIALKQSKLTNVVDRDTVYYGGCYVLGPDSQLIVFTASVHNVIEDIDVFTLDTISLRIRYAAHYFLRPAEVGQVYSMFLKDYDDVFRRIIRSSIRTIAGTTLTVDNFRFNRTYVETQIHAKLRRKLGGDCCPQCCRERICQSNAYCSQCKPEPCDQGFHIDVRYFNLLSVTIPDEVFERLLYRTILEVLKEREFHLQEHAVTQKETERITKNIKNQANEVVQSGQFEANKVVTIAEADKEKVVQTSYATALQGLFSRLNVTNEEEKLSLMLIRALEDSADNLYTGYGFDESILYAP